MFPGEFDFRFVPAGEPTAVAAAMGEGSGRIDERLAEAERTIDVLREALHRHHVAELALRATAITDAATGALNRRGLGERALAETARALRYGSHLSLLLLALPEAETDVDGMAARVVELVRRNVRQFDVIARLQPYRLALLLPETDAEGARALTLRLRDVLAAAAQRPCWRHLRLPPSFGAAEVEPLAAYGLRRAVAEAERGVERDSVQHV